MDRRRSPAEVNTRVEMTSSVTCTCSESAICRSLDEVEFVSRGLNLNLEQRDARGSMILQGDQTRDHAGSRISTDLVT